MKRARLAANLLCGLMFLMLMLPLGVFAEEAASDRWSTKATRWNTPTEASGCTAGS